MAVTIYRYSLFIFFSAIQFIASVQTKKDSATSFEYQDAYGNTISVRDISRLPSILDTAFLKSKVNGRLFSGPTASKTIFHYAINEITVIKKDQVFELRIHKYPKTEDVIELVKNNGYVHYKLYLKKGKSEIERVEFLYGEI
jgi:hypothetical protein